MERVSTASTVLIEVRNHSNQNFSNDHRKEEHSIQSCIFNDQSNEEVDSFLLSLKKETDMLDWWREYTTTYEYTIHFSFNDLDFSCSADHPFLSALTRRMPGHVRQQIVNCLLDGSLLYILRTQSDRSISWRRLCSRQLRIIMLTILLSWIVSFCRLTGFTQVVIIQRYRDAMQCPSACITAYPHELIRTEVFMCVRSFRLSCRHRSMDSQIFNWSWRRRALWSFIYRYKFTCYHSQILTMGSRPPSLCPIELSLWGTDWSSGNRSHWLSSDSSPEERCPNHFRWSVSV